MTKKKIFLVTICIIVILAIVLTILVKKDYKNEKIGNTIINKSANEVEAYILNMSSYQAKMEVTVQSNKNESKYVIWQEYEKGKKEVQEVKEPENINGLKTTYENERLIIENTKLNLTTIYEKYPYLTNNCLWLNSFCEEYQKYGGKIEKTEQEIHLKVKLEKSENPYIRYKILVIDKNTGKLSKLFVQDINQKTLVYILYTEIQIQ